MDFIPYKINEALSYKFYTIPMELFFNEKYINLSLEAKILYGIMLSVLTLSIKNNWKDENNNVYIILTRETIQKMLHISDKTSTKAFKQLKNCKLIYEKKQGRTKPNLIYVGKIEHDESIPNMIRKNYDSRSGKNTSQDSENLRPNYNKKNYTNKTINTASFDQRNYTKNFLNSFYANINLEELYEN